LGEKIVVFFPSFWCV
jgi:hypothetical protein